MIVIAALIDHRLDMLWLGLFIQLAVAVLGWRFLIDPGIPWASWWNTPFWEVDLGYAVPLALMGVAWWVMRPIKRLGAQLALESAVWSLGAVFALILLESALRSDIDSFLGALAGGLHLADLDGRAAVSLAQGGALCMGARAFGELAWRARFWCFAHCAGRHGPNYELGLCATLRGLCCSTR